MDEVGGASISITHDNPALEPEEEEEKEEEEEEEVNTTKPFDPKTSTPIHPTYHRGESVELHRLDEHSGLPDVSFAEDIPLIPEAYKERLIESARESIHDHYPDVDFKKFKQRKQEKNLQKSYETDKKELAACKKTSKKR